MRIRNVVLVSVIALTPILSPSGIMSQVKVGIRGGINSATLSTSGQDGHWEAGTMSSYVGPAIGGIVEWRLSNVFFARAEPMYIQEGTKYSFTYYIPTYGGPDIPEKVEQSLKIESLQLP